MVLLTPRIDTGEALRALLSQMDAGVGHDRCCAALANSYTDDLSIPGIA